MGKIDIRDLRVGDWVLYGITKSNMDGDYDVAFEYKKLTLDDFKFFCDNYWDATAFNKFLKPIPLTAEILEKNGFVENHGITSWKFETKREDLIDIYGVNEYHLSINIEDTHGSGKGYRWLLNNLVIFYVHQLQNILRDLEIEKEITI